MRFRGAQFFSILFVVALLISPQMAALATEDSQTDLDGSVTISQSDNAMDPIDVQDDGTAPAGDSQSKEGDSSDEPTGDDVSVETDESDPVVTDPVVTGDEGEADSGTGDEDGEAPSTDGDLTEGDSLDEEAPADGEADATDEGTPATDDEPVEGTVEASPDSATEDSGAGRMSRSSTVGINAVIDDGLYFYDVTWNDETNQAIIPLEVEAGFTAGAGDTFVINYSSDSLSLAPTQPAISGLPVTLSVNSAAESVTLTFAADFSVEADSTFPLVLNGEVQIPACLPGDGEQINGVYIEFWSTSSYADTFVQGENCLPGEFPVIDWVEFVPEMDAVVIELYIPSDQIEPGFVATITYQQDKINIPNGTTTEFYMGGDILNPISLATAVANDGVITITFHDFEIEDDDDWYPYFSGYLGATLEPVACVDVTSKDLTDLGRLFFVASPGGTFHSYIDVALCNAAPASKTGVLSDDGTEVVWTIDSGDLINGGSISDGFLITGQLFDCRSIEVQLISPSSQGWYDVDCGWENERYDDGFDVDFGGEGPVRAIVTVTGIVEQEFSFGSVVNCAVVSAGGREMPTALSTRDNNAGWGTTVCAEVHTAGIGDSISNTVSSPTVYQGETLTYTVNFNTTTGLWLVMSLDDVLPQGFDVTSVVCTFDPAELAEGVCAINPETNSLTVGLNRLINLEEEPESLGGGQITLVIEGTVTAEPGTELVSQACGVRAFEIPGMPPFFSQIGSGTLCASASTMVLQVPVETPTPSPTPDPTGTVAPDPTGTVTPGETPTATVEPDPTSTVTPGETPTATTAPGDPDATPGATTAPGEADPTATSAVTGLPSTGQGSSTGMNLLLAAFVASLLVTAAIGLRLRAARA